MRARTRRTLFDWLITIAALCVMLRGATRVIPLLPSPFLVFLFTCMAGISAGVVGVLVATVLNGFIAVSNYMSLCARAEVQRITKVFVDYDVRRALDDEWEMMSMRERRIAHYLRRRMIKRDE